MLKVEDTYNWMNRAQSNEKTIEELLPLDTVEDIQRAIRLFALVDDKQKPYMVTKINRKLRSLRLEFCMDKHHPFYRYVDKTCLIEDSNKPSDITTYEYQDFIYGQRDLIYYLVNDAEFKARPDVAKILSPLLNNPNKYDYLTSYIRWKYLLINASPSEYIITDVKQCAFRSLSFIFKAILKGLSEFDSFYGEVDKHFTIARTLISDIGDEIRNSIVCDKTVNNEDLVSLRFLYGEHTSLAVLDTVRQLQVFILLSVEDNTSLANELRDILEMEIVHCLGEFRDRNVSETEAVRRLSVRAVKSVKMLLETKNESESYLNIIATSNSLGNTPERVTESLEVSSEIDIVVTALTDRVFTKNLPPYVKSTTLSPSNKFALQSIDVVKNVSTINTVVNSELALAYIDNGVCIAVDGDSPGTVVLLELTDGDDTNDRLLDYLVNETPTIRPNAIVHTVKVNALVKDEKPVSLTEGLEVDPDGNIHFRFKKTTKYMDLYMENHKVLMHNFKSKNWDGLKESLSVAFALISEIERTVMHNKKKKVSDEKYKEAMNARMFLINDFKTYLLEVQKQDPSFNFSEYYESSPHGKTTLTLKLESIAGIKKLLRTIIAI